MINEVHGTAFSIIWLSSKYKSTLWEWGIIFKHLVIRKILNYELNVYLRRTRSCGLKNVILSLRQSTRVTVSPTIFTRKASGYFLRMAGSFFRTSEALFPTAMKYLFSVPDLMTRGV